MTYFALASPCFPESERGLVQRIIGRTCVKWTRAVLLTVLLCWIVLTHCHQLLIKNAVLVDELGVAPAVQDRRVEAIYLEGPSRVDSGLYLVGDANDEFATLLSIPALYLSPASLQPALIAYTDALAQVGQRASSRAPPSDPLLKA